MGSAIALDGRIWQKLQLRRYRCSAWDATPKHPDGGSVYLFDTEDFNIPASVEPTDELALIMLGDIKRTALLQNFPNPFNPETWIPYTLADDADVEVCIYDVQGMLVRQLDIGRQQGGKVSQQTNRRILGWQRSIQVRRLPAVSISIGWRQTPFQRRDAWLSGNSCLHG